MIAPNATTDKAMMMSHAIVFPRIFKNDSLFLAGGSTELLAAVGDAVGAVVGVAEVGVAVASVGETVGANVFSAGVGAAVAALSSVVGAAVGVSTAEENGVGADVAFCPAVAVGASVVTSASVVGDSVGTGVSGTVGALVGDRVGDRVGAVVGSVV